jgi:TolB protein
MSTHYRYSRFNTACVLLAVITMIWGGLSPLTTCEQRLTFASETTSTSPCQYIVLGGIADGNWDVVIVDTLSRQIAHLTQSVEDERDPAISPDGQHVAFSAHYEQNWDIYILDLSTGEIERLTYHPAYDGYPSWSNDGSHIAFESNRNGDIDIFSISINQGEIQRITDDPEADIEPLWMDEDEGLIFTSWRSGKRQMHQIDLASGKIVDLTSLGHETRHPILAPGGRYLAYVATQDSRSQIRLYDTHNDEVFFVSSGSRHLEWPFWHSASQEQEDMRPELLAMRLNGAGDYSYPTGWSIVARPDIRPEEHFQHKQDLPGMQWHRPSCIPSKLTEQSMNWYQLSEGIRISGRTYQDGLAVIPDVQALQPRLSVNVVEPYQQLREAVRNKSGYDFLDELYDAWRGLDHPENAYISWHTAGRAIDVRNWYQLNNERILYNSRQNLGGQTYFRIHLHTLRQDGSQGRPLRESLWETDRSLPGLPPFDSSEIRQTPPLNGYFVDFTEVAESRGWTRIPALTPPDGDWSSVYLDLEFWHYEYRDGLDWYMAMNQIYTKEQLGERFTPDRVLSEGYTVEQLISAGIPGASQLTMDGINCRILSEGSSPRRPDVLCVPDTR